MTIKKYVYLLLFFAQYYMLLSQKAILYFMAQYFKDIFCKTIGSMIRNTYEILENVSLEKS